MQIRFNNILLAGEFRESTSDLSRDVATVIQEAQYLEGSEPEWFERGNYKSSISFSTHRVFENVMEAELFFLEHGDNEGTNEPTELVGIVEFICGDTPQSIRYARGKLTMSFPKPIGVSVFTQYRLEYGRLSITKPTD